MCQPALAQSWHSTAPQLLSPGQWDEARLPVGLDIEASLLQTMILLAWQLQGHPRAATPRVRVKSRISGDKTARSQPALGPVPRSSPTVSVPALWLPRPLTSQ